MANARRDVGFGIDGDEIGVDASEKRETHDQGYGADAREQCPAFEFHDECVPRIQLQSRPASRPRPVIDRERC
jgi:hypothetical protein